MNEANFSDECILRLIKLPDLLSVLNALLGFAAILFVLAGVNVSENAIKNALVLILVAAVVDGLDGMVARKVEYSPLGKYLDSLADMISFGVAPAIVVYALLRNYFHVHAYAYVTLALCGAYVISGLLRLARFNAKSFFQKESFTKETRFSFSTGFPLEKEKVSSSDFEGFPITWSAIFLASFMLVFIELHLLPFYPYSYLLIGLMGILCFLMTSRIRYRNTRDKRLGIPVGIVFFTLFLFYMFSLQFIYPALAVVTLTAFYILSPLLYVKKQRIFI